jgi:hypothetical protein
MATMGAMLPIRRFISAIGADWLARMSGPLTVPFTVAAFFLPSTVAKISFTILAVIAALITCFRIWNTAETEKEQLRAELAEAKKADAPARDWNAEWKELSGKFEKVGLDVSAQWQCNRRNNQTIFENWNLSGTYRKQCEALCVFAGALLLKSPNASPGLSELARQQSDPVWRWLFFLKENHNALSSGLGSLPQIDSDGTIYLMGHISNLAVVSAQACMECAALEL